jgi:MFS family permease
MRGTPRGQNHATREGRRRIATERERAATPIPTPTMGPMGTMVAEQQGPSVHSTALNSDKRPAKSRAWDNRSFRYLVSANTISALGDGLLVVALPLLAASLTTVAWLVTGVFAIGRVPWMLAPFLGAWSDRQRNPIRTMIATDLTRGITLAALAIVVVLDLSTALALAVAYLAAFVIGVGDVLFASSSFTAVRLLLPDDHLSDANSKISAVQSWGEQVVGPLIGGAIFKFSRFVPVIADSLSFLLSCYLLSRLPPIEKPVEPAEPVQTVVATSTIPDTRGAEPSRRSLRREAVEGWRAMRNDSRIWRVVVWATLMAFGYSMQVSALVLIGEEQLGLDGMSFGLFAAIIAIGNVIGALVAPRLLRRFDEYSMLIISTVFMATFNGLAATNRNPVFVTLALAFDGVWVLVANVTTYTLRQRLAPPNMIGRVMATSKMMVVGIQVLGALVGGIIIDRFNTQAALFTTSAIGFVLLATVSRWLRAGFIQARDEAVAKLARPVRY